MPSTLTYTLSSSPTTVVGAALAGASVTFGNRGVNPLVLSSTGLTGVVEPKTLYPNDVVSLKPLSVVTATSAAGTTLAVTTVEDAATTPAGSGGGFLGGGNYFFTASPSATSTSATLNNGTLRLSPWLVPNTCRVTRIGAEITTAGDAGCKYRLGIYADNGYGYPGALVLDAGMIAGDSAAVQELTVDQVLTAGLYWVGGVVQLVTTTQPTVRIQGSATQSAVPLPLAAIPAANGTIQGVSQVSVTGALPATFTTTLSLSGSAPRIFVKAA